MTKIELEEIFKIIDNEISKAHSDLSKSKMPFDQQYFIGKKHALRDIKNSIYYQNRNILETKG